MPIVRMEVLEEASVEAILKELDTTDELREVSAVRITSYQQRLASSHNRCVKLHTFKAKELVLRRVFENTFKPTDGKFQPNWIIHGGMSRDNRFLHTEQTRWDGCS